MIGTHLKGVIGELEFIREFILKGYNVLQPVNPNSSYDLVVEKNGKFSRIQVKYATPRNDLIRVELIRPKRKTQKYQLRGVDAMAIYDSVHKAFYLVSIQDIGNRSNFWLRLSDPKNAQKKNVHFAKDYLFD